MKCECGNEAKQRVVLTDPSGQTREVFTCPICIRNFVPIDEDSFRTYVEHWIRVDVELLPEVVKEILENC